MFPQTYPECVLGIVTHAFNPRIGKMRQNGIELREDLMGAGGRGDYTEFVDFE